MANLPILVYLLTQRENIKQAQESQLFNVCMALKTLRLFHIHEVTETLGRLVNKLADIFYLRRYLFFNLLKWILAGMKFVLSVHYFACGWIMIQGRKKS